MINILRAAALAVILVIPTAKAQTAETPQTETLTTESAPQAVPTPPAAAAPAPPAAPSSSAAPPVAATAANAADEQAQAEARARAFYDSLHRQTGVISIAGGKAQLNVPETHYFIGPEDTRRVLVDVWGNPPDSAQGVEGMIFPRDGNPATGSWGAVVQYSADGYVSDSDASTTNYDEVLHNMQSAAERANAQRRTQGFPPVHVVGWAERPHYDAVTHKIYWGRQIHFDDNATVDTLNYDIRVLGRSGYLVISFVSSMPDLAAIEQSTPAVLAMADFTNGNRYADYHDGVDQRAAYGLGGLIAGGAAIAVAQKVGLLSMLLLLGKKFIVIIGVAIAAIGNFFRRMFGRKPKEPAMSEPPSVTS